MRIHKYAIPLDDTVILKLPLGSRIIHAGRDPLGVINVWAEVNPDEIVTREYRIEIRGTGHELGVIEYLEMRHVSSFLDGSFVWHVYTKDHER